MSTVPTPIDQNRIDALASEVTHRILSQPDYKQNEYVAVLYRDDSGELKATPLFGTGHTDRAPLGRALAAAGGNDRVVGVVHNHPPSIVATASTSDQDEARDINKLPSDNDWSGARKVFSDRDDVTYYLLGPDMALRKYDYQDNAAWDRKNDHEHWDRNRSRFETGPQLQVEPAPDPRAPDHQDHALYRQILEKTQEAYEKAGRPAAEGEHERVAASLLAETKRDHRGQFERADAVVFSVDPKSGEVGRRIFVVQGDPSDPASLRSDAKTTDAARQPLEQSFDKVYDANQRLFLQQHERGDVVQVPQQSAPSAPAPAR
ncbi:hypothetical protein RDV84_07870 [Lysobacter yananisis]|uniref:X-Tfes XVIPCD domain-containing protein n=1 Tax=Lysobacter yananisis TaxID=1003114 RepID=A0ABY9PCI1_9GAMM|nr:XVIPCD domain-containing protein [Lysobacter yananisis]WMT04742.1 hypothetical protein RDV84_07870 [Lysobacter yananisis]